MPTPSISVSKDGGGHSLKMPPYNLQQKAPSEKGQNGMYIFTDLDFNTREVKAKSGDILSSLTLFAPYSHEDDPPSDVIELDRPVTPINEEIKVPPQLYETLAKYVRRRIPSTPEISHLSEEDQQGLAAVIMGEIVTMWPDIRSQVNDPFLNAEENRELQRRVTVHIVTVCERLFQHYIQKAQS